MPAQLITIGEISRRTGLAVSAIRFYEEKGFIEPIRNSGGHRRFLRSDIRRLSLVMVAQKLGFSLAEIAEEMHALPMGRAPTKQDWSRVSTRLRARISDRIARLERLRETLDGCIGCGCLSVSACKLYNPDDQIAEKGPGPRFALGDRATRQND